VLVRLLLPALLLLASCGGDSTPVRDPDDVRFDGLNNPPAIQAGPHGVYMVARDGAVWWLHDGKAERVEFPK
jgi:hypothetical protein